MIGKLTERVRFVTRARTQLAGGSYATADEVLGEVWAEVRPVEAREGEQIGRRYGSTSYVITMHADDKPPTLNVGHHVIWITGDNAPMNLRAIRQSRRGVLFLELVAEAGAVI